MAIKKIKYKVGQMVYSYQNPTVKYPITWIRESKLKGYDHAYKLSLKNGYSNWINEKSIYLTKKENKMRITGLGGVDTLPKANFGNVSYKVIKDGTKFNVMVSTVGGSAWKVSKGTSKKEAIKLLNIIIKDVAKRTGQVRK
jgi:hypothetical protein